jgi:hypothetical protein
MLKISCNIDKNDRINRTVIGVVLILGAIMGLGYWFFMLAGLILIIEGLVGWCGIPALFKLFKE